MGGQSSVPTSVPTSGSERAPLVKQDENQAKTPEDDELKTPNEKAEAKEGESARVPIDIDAYDAVAVSAFGGIRAYLPKKEKRKGGIQQASVLVHPFAMLMANIPLTLVQFLMIFFLRADVSMDAPVREGAPEDGWSVSHNRRLQIQLLSIVVVQGMVFKELFNATVIFGFLLNPFTWVEIYRPIPKQQFSQFFYKAGWLAPFTWISLGIKIGIAYLVSADSISIIFECSSAKDTVFNSLVILFIIDLDAAYWGVLQTVFKFSDFDGFDFRTASKRWRDDLEKNQSFYLAQTIRSYCDFLKRHRYGRTIEQVIAAALLMTLYMRQIAMILNALDRNVLPSAVDVCTQWRLERSRSQTSMNKQFFGPVLRKAEAIMHLEELPMQLQGVNTTFNMTLCDEDKYDRMTVPNLVATLMKHKGATICWGGALLLVLVLPVTAQLIRENLPGLISRHLKKFERSMSTGEEEEDEDEDFEAGFHNLKEVVEMQKQENDKLKGSLLAAWESIEELRAKFPDLPAVPSTTKRMSLFKKKATSTKELR